MKIASVVALAALACAGCAAGSAGPPPHTRTGPTIQLASATVGQNKAATRKEAARLLGLARLPAGVTPVTGKQPKLPGPALGSPDTASLIDLHRYWKSAMSMASVFGYLRSHRPTGLTFSGTGHSGTTSGDITSEGIGWDEANTAYAEELGLDVSLTPVKGGTLIRVDGMGEWIDPRPIRDTATPRLRVTVAAGCPSTDKGKFSVSNPGAGLDKHLVPSATATSALICEYGGLNSKPRFRLVHHVLMSASRADRLAKQAAAISLGHLDGSVMSCPMDDGSVDVVVFHYKSRPDVDLWDRVNGCQTIANGHILANGGLTGIPTASPGVG